jgi:hypothetical protein
MKPCLLIMICVCAAAAGAPVAVATPQTVAGQIIDLACYALDKANTSNVHRGRGYTCGQACAREGFAVGLLAGDGKVYQITGGLAANKNARLVPHMSHTVKITGDVGEKDGIATIAADDLEMAK